MLNFNDAPEQMAVGGLIPDNTPAMVVMNLRAGGSAKDPWFTDKTKDGATHSFLDCEFTIMGGDHDKRKLWSENIIVGNGSDGHATAENITRGFLRGVIEAVNGINPKDQTPEAMAARNVPGFHWFHLRKFPVMIGVEKGRLKPGQGANGEKYPDKNVVRFAITPDKPEYFNPGQQEPIPAEKPAAIHTPANSNNGGGGGGSYVAPAHDGAAAAAAAGVPDWAK